MTKDEFEQLNEDLASVSERFSDLCENVNVVLDERNMDKLSASLHSSHSYIMLCYYDGDFEQTIPVKDALTVDSVRAFFKRLDDKAQAKLDAQLARDKEHERSTYEQLKKQFESDG